MGLPELQVMPDTGAAARAAAETIAERARGVVAERGSFTLALSGGTAPWQAFRLFAELDVPWEATEIFQVDERVAPPGDDDRNLTHLQESLPPAAVARLRPMPVEAGDLGAAAAEYAALLPAHLDLIHLGLGPDGHTASLVPGDPVLDVTDCTVAVTGEYQGRRRMTLTYPPLDGARGLLWLVTGDSKVEPLKLLLAGDPSIPAGRVRAARSLVIADPAAVGN
jgi:6-phosphogluconolactonase/glucosamine-6-phosphate isomerase/deaminase